MFKNAIRPAWVEINLSNLDYNIKEIQKKAGAREYVGVIKADGYGCGSVEVAKVLLANGVKTFAVATLKEAVVLRDADIKEEIIVLGLTPDMYADVLLDYDLTAVVCCSKNVQAFSEAAAKLGKTMTVLLAADTGMGRIGYLTDEASISFAVEDIKKILSLPNIKVRGLFSHMSTADEADKTYSKFQEANFDRLYQALLAAGLNIPTRNFANSASIMEVPTVHFDTVRPGIILYGCYPSDEVNPAELSIKPVMSVKADIVHLKEVPIDFSVGYGRKFISERPSKIATLELGYADGYPRPFSSEAKVIVNGVFAPITGNICMDQCMVDVTDVPNVKVGDEVIIMGTDGNLSVTAETIAKATGTINYEILCSFGQRLPKVYVK